MEHYFERYRSSFTLKEESPESPGFRRCQLGAVWASKSHFTVSRSHALVNMPTGTGKTGVMIALAFELAPRRVFVLAPSRLIREQTATKFASMRLLRKIGAIPDSLVARPKVKEIKARPQSPEEWQELLDYDVVVATPHTVSPSYGVEPPKNFFGAGDGDAFSDSVEFDLLFVDEAHHAPASSWNSFLELATGTRVVYMTATPFRRDRRRIRAKPIYSYPISRAMKEGIYRAVRFEPVDEPDAERRDYLLADKALSLFKTEREINPDATIIVKAKTIKDAERLVEVYKQSGWENLGIIHSKRAHGENLEVIKGVRHDDNGNGTCKQLDGFISVDMGGEGIDIPNLKIAVFHQAPKTLPYTVQLVGRVSRVEKGQRGDAILIADPRVAKGSEVQELYASDKGWSEILPDLFSGFLERSKFLPDAGSRLSQMPWLAADDLNPYLSVKVYQNVGPAGLGGFLPMPMGGRFWKYDLDVEIFERRGNMVVVLTKTWEVPRWTKNRAFEVEHFDLHLFYLVDSLLFEFTSSEAVCKDIRRAVYDQTLYRRARHHLLRKALSDASGGNYYMLGLRNQSGIGGGLPQYKTYLGEDVQMSVRMADGRNFGAGHAVVKKDREIRGIAIRSSRIWSNKRLPLDEFQIWCDRLAKLIGIAGEQPIPHVEDKLMEAEEIPVYPGDATPVTIIFDDIFLSVERLQFLIDAEPYEDPLCVFRHQSLEQNEHRLTVALDLVDPDTGDAFKTLRLAHDLRGNPFWKVLTKGKIEVNIDPGPNRPDILWSLDELLEKLPPLIVFDSGATVRDNILFKPKIQTQRIDPGIIEAKSWDGTDVRKETDEPGIDPDTKEVYVYNVLDKTIRLIKSEYSLGPSDLLICDDRAHEVADLVLIREDRKRITFFHCKYKVSKGRVAGAARADVTELADQGVRNGHWIRAAELMERLRKRVESTRVARKKEPKKKGSTIEHGSASQLDKLAASFFPDQWSYSVVLVQPGLSKEKVERPEPEQPSQAEQLLLMLHDRITADYGATFRVWSSA